MIGDTGTPPARGGWGIPLTDPRTVVDGRGDAARMRVVHRIHGAASIKRRHLHQQLRGDRSGNSPHSSQWGNSSDRTNLASTESLAMSMTTKNQIDVKLRSVICVVREVETRQERHC